MERWRLSVMSGEQVMDRVGGLDHQDVGSNGSFGMRRVATAGMPGSLQDGGGLELPRDVVLSGQGDHVSWNGSNRIDDEAVARSRLTAARGDRLRSETVAGAETIPDLRW